MPTKTNKTRKIINTIKINNGKLTYEEDEYGHGDWYRNGKRMAEPEKYKFYDPSIKHNRTLLLGHAQPIIDIPTIIKLTNDDDKDRRPRQIYEDKYPWSEDITLRTNGRMNLATIPLAMLDSIAVNSGRSNTPVKQNLGLVGKESTFGGYSRPMTKTQINATKEQLNYTPDSYKVYGLVNNHRFAEGKYSDILGAIDRLLYPKNYGDLSQEQKDKLTIEAERRAKYAVEHGTAENKNHLYSDDYLEDAFIRYNTNPAGYNPGQENYVPMVNNIANEVWNEPQIQNWWNTSGKAQYERGRKEGKTRKKHKSLED